LLATHSFPFLISVWRLPTCDRLAADSPTLFPVGKVERDPFNRPHSRAVIEITSNYLLREVFSAKFHVAKALFTKWLHLVDFRCIATIGFCYRNSFRSASIDSMNRWIVCPKLRVSPLNAQIEFKVFSMQTIFGFFGQKQLVINIVRCSDSYCFPCIPPTPRWVHCLPPSLAIQVGVPSCVSLAQPFGRSVLHLRLQLSYQRLVFTISIIISLFIPSRRSYPNSSRYRSDFPRVCNSVRIPVACTQLI
jgi:hypothetical protein